MAALLTFACNTDPVFSCISFAIFVGGFVPQQKEYSSIFYETEFNKIRTLHIIGKGDTVIDAAKSLELSNRYKDPMVIFHSGGHYIPTHKEVILNLQDFMGDQRVILHLIL